MEGFTIAVPVKYEHLVKPASSMYLLVPQEEYIRDVNESRKHQDECKVLIAKNASLEEQISQMKKDIKSIIEK